MATIWLILVLIQLKAAWECGSRRLCHRRLILFTWEENLISRSNELSLTSLWLGLSPPTLAKTGPPAYPRPFTRKKERDCYHYNWSSLKFHCTLKSPWKTYKLMPESPFQRFWWNCSGVQSNHQICFPGILICSRAWQLLYIKHQLWSLKKGPNFMSSRYPSCQLNEREVDKWRLVASDSHFSPNLAKPMKEKFSLPIFPVKVPNWIPWTCLWVWGILQAIVIAKEIENPNGPILGNGQERKYPNETK